MNYLGLLFVDRYDIIQKGIDLLFDVLQLLPKEVTLDFAGTGNKEQKKKVEKLIKQRKLESRVDLYGALDGETMKSFYKSGGVFLSTSRWEGFGLVLVEAMEFGLPIIAFETEGAREIIQNNKYGILIEKYDVKKMTRSILDLRDIDEKRKLLEELSKSRANDFSTDNISMQWMQVINKMYI